jgi:hypothetical protein
MNVAAIELASWNPLVKVKAKARSMMRIASSNMVTVPGSPAGSGAGPAVPQRQYGAAM